MRRYAISFALLPFTVCFLCPHALGDTPSAADGALTLAERKTLANQLRLDFTVPESPAFQLLQIDEAHILRPGSAKELGLAISSMIGENGITVPRQFGVEFAPLMLAKGINRTQAQTASQAGPMNTLESFRISAAAARADSQSQITQFAIGFRASLKDEQDLRRQHYKQIAEQASSSLGKKLTDSIQYLNEKLLNSVSELSFANLSIAEILDESIANAIRDSLINGYTVSSTTLSHAGLDTAVAQDVLNLQASDDFKELVAAQNAAVSAWIEAVTEAAETEQWNENTAEVATSFLFQTADSTGRKPALKKASVWSSYAFGYGAWSQWLLGINLSWSEDDSSGKRPLAVALANRFYIGRNDYKFFLEESLDLEEEKKARWFLNSGGEIKVQSDIWFDFSAGIEFDPDNNSQQLVTKFNIKSGLDGLFRVEKKE